MPKALGNPVAACIYVISDPGGERPLTKVGFSIWPQRRCEQLRQKHKADLSVHHMIMVARENAHSLERLVHHRLNEFAVGNEWFAVPAFVAVEIASRAADDFEAGDRVPPPPKRPRIVIPTNQTFIDRLDAWRATQRPIPTRSDAARHLMAIALAEAEASPLPLPDRDKGVR